MKKVQDYYFEKAKKEKYPARSVYKLEEAQKKFRFIQAKDAILDLGCFPGSWAIYAAKIVGVKGRVIGIDLQQVRLQRPTNGVEIEFVQGDVFDDGLAVLQEEGCFNVVLSDMAPKTSGNRFSDHIKSVALAARALEIARSTLAMGGNFYCKVFQGEDSSQFVEETRCFFTKVKVVKPKSSRSESREIFVLGRGFRNADF